MLFALILKWMIQLQPNAAWSVAFESTAVEIANVILEERALFGYDSSRERTAALMVSIAWYESRFDRNAINKSSKAKGLYQDMSHPEVLGHARRATRVALRMVRESFRICAAYPIEERLGWYAEGGPNCSNERGRRLSRIRFQTANQLLRGL